MAGRGELTDLVITLLPGIAHLEAAYSSVMMTFFGGGANKFPVARRVLLLPGMSHLEAADDSSENGGMEAVLGGMEATERVVMAEGPGCEEVVLATTEEEADAEAARVFGCGGDIVGLDCGGGIAKSAFSTFST